MIFRAPKTPAPPPCKRLPAFSLLEMALVLVIFGIVLAAVLPLLSTATIQQKRLETTRRQERIFTLLGAFATTYPWLLPLPVAETPLVGPQVSAPPTQRQPLASLAPHLHRTMGETVFLYVGRVPHKTLEIPEEWTRDAWGHPMTYAIAIAPDTASMRPQMMPESMDMKHSVGHYAPPLQTQAFDSLQVSDHEGVTTRAFIVLISHGSKGAPDAVDAEGAGGRVPDKLENANGDAHFVSHGPQEGFDDVVSFLTVSHFNSLYAPNLKEAVSFKPPEPDAPPRGAKAESVPTPPVVSPPVDAGSTSAPQATPALVDPHKFENVTGSDY